MNAKNLPLKFAFLALVVALCLGSLFWWRGLRWGIDLQGGHSLIFEIRTREKEMQRLEADKQATQKQLADAEAAGDTATADRLRKTVEGIDAEIQRYASAGDDTSDADLAERIIAILKNRIDPQGLRSLEWRPLGRNRIEVRMPAAKAETQSAKTAYDSAVTRLKDNNLTNSRIRQLLQAREAAQQSGVAALAAGDEAAAMSWSQAVAAEEAAAQAKQAVAAAEEALADLERRLAAVADTPGQSAMRQRRNVAAAVLADARERLATAQRGRSAALAALGEGADAKLEELIAASASAEAGLLKTFAQGSEPQEQRLAALIEADHAVKQAERRLAQATAAHQAAIEGYTRLRPQAEAPPAAGDLADRLAAARARVTLRDAVEKQAQVDRRDAVRRYESARKLALEYGQINPARLQEEVLDHYVSPREASASQQEGYQQQIARRRELFDRGLRAFREKYPQRTDLGAVVEAYQGWADLRQYLDDPEDLQRLIRKAGVLEFRIVPYLEPFAKQEGSSFFIPNAEYRRYEELLKTEGPEGVRKRGEKFIWLPLRKRPKPEEYTGLPITRHLDGQWYMLLYNADGFTMLHEPPPTGWRLRRARPSVDQYGRPDVVFRFDARGAQLFARLTNAHKPQDNQRGHCMAILLDDQVYSAPVIQAVIATEGEITGDFTREEAAELAKTLEAGSLPARLNPDPVAQTTFGPSIGEVNRQMGFRAAYWGLIGVAGFMLIYYLLAGAIADVALMLNIVLILGAMSLMSAVFTLPGIAGVILTIGIAVDANVLIFERLREEQAKGQSVRMALKNAYQRAFSAIFDANVTTLITCFILGWVGTEEVRGFGITLGLGVVFSMFTALVVTRWVFQVLLDRRLLRRPLRMLQIIGTPRINWMTKRHFFWGLSALMMVLGVGSLIWQGGDILGIEFTSGTQAVVRLRGDALLTDPSAGERVLPDDGLVRRLLVAQAEKEAAAGKGPAYAKLAATARVERRIDPYRAQRFIAEYDRNGDGAVAAGEYTGDPEYFKRVDDGDGTLSRAELEERLPAEEYQLSTTVQDVQVVRDVRSAAFGDALEIRRPCTYALAGAGDRVPAMGVAVGQLAHLTEALLPKIARAYRYEMEDYVGGTAFVVNDLSPALTGAELEQRIRDARGQEDFADLRFSRTKVIPLGAPGAGGKNDRFVVCVAPAEPVPADRLPRLRQREAELLDLALTRAEAGEITHFDPAIAGEMRQLAIVAIILSWLAIVAYLWFRFGSVQWGLAAVICLVHDVVIVVGLVAISGWVHNTWLGAILGIDSFKIDLAMIAAILTVIGYSVNDTIVVFDRIRENRGKLTTVSGEVINRSINQTLSRTLLTSGTTFIVVFVMYVWGGPGIHAFNYALLMGVLFGTYSSVAVASPLLMGFKKALVAKAVGVLPVEQQQV